MMYNLKCKKTIRAVVAAVLAAATITQCFWAVAESNVEAAATPQWLIGSELTTAEYDDSLYSKYFTDCYESNSADVVLYNERGESTYTYTLSGTAGKTEGALELHYYSSGDEVGQHFAEEALSDGGETFSGTDDRGNFYNSVYGLGTGFELPVPQIEYISPSAAYFHLGDGTAYRIGRLPKTNESDPDTYRLCGYPYSFTLAPKTTGEDNGTETVSGFEGTDRFGTVYSFDRNGRCTTVTAQGGTVLFTLSYQADGRLLSYTNSDSGYTVTFNRAAVTGGENIVVRITAGEDSVTAATLTVRSGKLTSIVKNTSQNSSYSTSLEGSETEDIETASATTTQETVVLNYQTQNNAVLLNARSMAVDTNLDGYSTAELSSVRSVSTTNTSYSYAAKDPQNTTAVTLAESYNATRVNYYNKVTDEYTLSSELALKSLGQQSLMGYNRLAGISRTTEEVCNPGYDPTDDCNNEETDPSPNTTTTNSTAERTLTYSEETGKVIGDNATELGDQNTKTTVTYSYGIDSAVAAAAAQKTGETVTGMTTVHSCTYTAETGVDAESEDTGDETGNETESGEPEWVADTDSEQQTVSARNRAGDVVYEKSSGSETYFGYNQNGSPVKEVRTGGLTYNYTYDNYQQLTRTEFDLYAVNYSGGNITSIEVDGRPLTSYDYSGMNLTGETYANGQALLYDFDDDDNVIAAYSGAKTDENKLFSYVYSAKDANGDQQLQSVTDYKQGRKSVYSYSTTDSDEITAFTVYNKTDETDPNAAVLYSYSAGQNSKSVTVGDNASAYSYSSVENTSTGSDGETEEITTTNTTALTVDNHSWKSINQKNEDNLLTKQSIEGLNGVDYQHKYTYDEDGRVSTEFTGNGDNEWIQRLYIYDANGNISEADMNYYGIAYRTLYSYNDKNELVRADDTYTGKTYVYSYDDRGNILDKKEYNYTEGNLTNATPLKTDVFNYATTGWNDRISAINGEVVTYDASGNPTGMQGYSYTWENGRQLKALTNGTNTFTYAYDDSGIRTEKTVNGETVHYITDDGKVIAQYTDSMYMSFWYDEDGAPFGFTVKNANDETTACYVYEKNALGDIVGIVGANGEHLVSYYYDAWGNIAKMIYNNAVVTEENGGLASLNPFRYRGYYYDSETGYYYLQSRYYNPKICRFINADNAFEIIDEENGRVLNGYYYCDNNAIMNVDEEGTAYVSNDTFVKYRNTHSDLSKFIRSQLIIDVVSSGNSKTNDIEMSDRCEAIINDLKTLYPKAHFRHYRIADKYEFINYWNNTNADILILNCHGNKGKLAFLQDDLSCNEIDNKFEESRQEYAMEYKSNIKYLFLSACYGADKDNGKSALNSLAAKISGIAVGSSGEGHAFRKKGAKKGVRFCSDNGYKLSFHYPSNGNDPSRDEILKNKFSPSVNKRYGIGKLRLEYRRKLKAYRKSLWRSPYKKIIKQYKVLCKLKREIQYKERRCNDEIIKLINKDTVKFINANEKTYVCDMMCNMMYYYYKNYYYYGK